MKIMMVKKIVAIAAILVASFLVIFPVSFLWTDVFPLGASFLDALSNNLNNSYQVWSLIFAFGYYRAIQFLNQIKEQMNLINRIQEQLDRIERSLKL